MSDHRITLNWQRGNATFERGSYPKDHEVRYLGGQTLGVSSAAAYGGNAALADPEQDVRLAAAMALEPAQWRSRASETILGAYRMTAVRIP